MMETPKATMLRRAALSAAAVALCLPVGQAVGQHGNHERQESRPSERRAAPQPRREAPAARPAPRSAPQERSVPNPAPQVRPVYPERQPVLPGGAQGFQPRTNSIPHTIGPAPTYPQAPQNGSRPGVYPGPPYLGPNQVRPAYPGYPRPLGPPPGHLQSWLNEHRNVPVQNQEQLLRNDPSFKRLPQSEQNRLVRQLQDVNRLSEQQRQRRLARNEALERLSPMEQMRVNRASQDWRQLPVDRQAMMKSAFRDLRSVPPDQRSIVLNSARYQGQFTPQERGILTEMLKVEPYEPPR